MSVPGGSLASLRVAVSAIPADRMDVVAGSYGPLPASVVFPPSLHLLGSPLPRFSEDGWPLSCAVGAAPGSAEGCWPASTLTMRS